MANLNEDCVMLCPDGLQPYYWNRRTGDTSHACEGAAWAGRQDPATSTWYYWRIGRTNEQPVMILPPLAEPCQATRRYGSDCQRGLHGKPTSTQPRGDGFRPYITDTDEDKTVKQHLATLGLSPFCEQLQDHDSKMVETIYKQLAKYRHPDKNTDEESHARFIQLQIAKDYIIARLPFRMAK